MCILLKLEYAKFDVSNFFFSKVIEEKPLGRDRLDPLLVRISTEIERYSKEHNKWFWGRDPETTLTGAS